MKEGTPGDARVVSKDGIIRLLDQLIQECEVFAPVRRDDVVRFDRITSGHQALLQFSNSRMSPKEVFFPPSEVMFSYEGTGVEVPSLEARRVLFGVRPCDARSLVVLDRVFNGPDYQDVYYVQKRERTCVVAMGCEHPLSTCFCGSVGGGPFGDEGLDVLLSDIGERYLVEAISEKGRGLLAATDWPSPTESDLRQKERVAQRAETRLGCGAATDLSKLGQAEGLKETLRAMYEDALWDELREKCLGCAVCAYVCPTCHCFDIVDEGVKDRGRRVRTWDCCQFSLFTLHASGHNPRPSGKERMRQRIMHKFRYFVENCGQVACVGCGRCILNCPVNIDLRQVLNQIAMKQGAGSETTATRQGQKS